MTRITTWYAASAMDPWVYIFWGHFPRRWEIELQFVKRFKMVSVCFHSWHNLFIKVETLLLFDEF